MFTVGKHGPIEPVLTLTGIEVLEGWHVSHLASVDCLNRIFISF